ncbi:MAG: methyltransferase [Pseudomonadota bacterium]
MTDTARSSPLRAGIDWLGWRNRIVARPGFQRWAARNPLTRGHARKDGEAIFDLVAGFVHSQVLAALIELDILNLLRPGPQTLDDLALATDIVRPRLEVLMQAGAALGLLRRLRPGVYALARKGAALTGVPGLTAMIRHHAVLYRDLADPAAFFRDAPETELARFWPYVFGGDGVAPDVARTYSDLMADSQALVADETLAAVSLRGVSHLLDVGGGSGAFLIAALRTEPNMKATLFDLPAVGPAAQERLGAASLADRVSLVAGSFRDQSLPDGADAISLVRVLYDHADATVEDLLKKVFQALPAGGRLIVAEPMSGGARPERAGDAYFAIYTLAMGTGRTRSSEEIGGLLRAAGFEQVRTIRTRRAFVTSVVTAVKPF